MLVGYVEELEIEPESHAGRFRVILRHRDLGGKLYTVSVHARRVVSHDVTTEVKPRIEGRIYRFPKLELAAFMDGDVLRVCKRADVLRYLRPPSGHADRHPDDGRDLV